MKALIEKALKLFQSGFKNLSTSSSMKARVARGGLWLGAGSSFEQLSRLLRNMILTRILAPEAFGLMAIVLAVNAAFESFTQVGIKEAIIQNPDGRDRTYLNGAWWFAFARGLALYLIVFACAPWIANFYGNPELVLMMRVAFLVLLFNGIMSSEAYVAIKQMKFKRWVIIFHGGGVLGIVTAVLMAFIIKNVWALVIGFSVEGIARCILSYIICPFFPGINFDREKLRSLLKFAKGMIGLPILTFIFMRADVFVIGKLCPMSELGLYSMAAMIAWAPFQFISSITGRIMMPAFSEKQSNNEWINKWTLKITSMIATMGFPLLCFVIFYGRDVLTLVYGTRYGSVSIPFAIIFATALMRTSSLPIATVYMMSGRPELQRLFTGIRAILMVAFIFPATKWFGVNGAATAGLVSMLIGFLLQVRRMHEITGLDIRQYYRIFFHVLCISTCVIILWVFTRSLSSSGPIVHMIPGVAGCLIAYAIAIKIFFRTKPGSAFSP